jgi:hypothetical protein
MEERSSTEGCAPFLLTWRLPLDPCYKLTWVAENFGSLCWDLPHDVFSPGCSSNASRSAHDNAHTTRWRPRDPELFFSQPSNTCMPRASLILSSFLVPRNLGSSKSQWVEESAPRDSCDVSRGENLPSVVAPHQRPEPVPQRAEFVKSPKIFLRRPN